MPKDGPRPLPKPLHGLCWLRRDGESLAAVSSDLAMATTAELIGSVEHLPSGLGSVELHWFGGAAEAKAFASGVRAAGANAVSAIPGEGEGAERGVLLFRADRERPGGDRLEDVVPFVAHAPSAPQRAKLRWRHLTSSIRTISPNPAATVQPIRLGDSDENSIAVRVCYSFWGNTISGRRRGGDNYFSIVDRRGEDWIELPTTHYPEVLKASARFRDKLAQVAERDGWIDEGAKLARRIGEEGLAAHVEGLGESFHALWLVEHEAQEWNRLEAIRRDGENRRIVNAMRGGATLRIDGSKPPHFLERPDGRRIRVSPGRLDDLERAGLVERGENGVYVVADGEAPRPAP